MADELAVLTLPLRALARGGSVEAVVAAGVIEGIDAVRPLLELVAAQADAAERRALLARGDAQTFIGRADRLEESLSALAEREGQRWSNIAARLGADVDANTIDQLAIDLGVHDHLRTKETFDEFMLDDSAPLILGQGRRADDHESATRGLDDVARRTAPPFATRLVTVLAQGDAAVDDVANAPGCGACLEVDGGAVLLLLGDGTVVRLDDGRLVIAPAVQALSASARPRQLGEPYRWVSGSPPVLLRHARAAYASALASSEASIPADNEQLAAFLIFRAAVVLPEPDIAGALRRLRAAAHERGDPSAMAATLVEAAWELARVRVSRRELPEEAVSVTAPAIEVGRVRWCTASQLPVFWLPVTADDANQVGGHDRPWTMDPPAAGAEWHAVNPATRLDPSWFGRLFVVPGQAQVICLDPAGQWWSLDVDYRSIVDARLEHLDIWLEMLERAEAEVAKRVSRIRSRAAELHELSARGAKRGTIAPTADEPEPLSRAWIEQRAAEYEYADDEAPRLAGARAASRGYYERAEFLTVVRWKSARALPLAELNTAASIESATREALAADNEITRIVALLQLRGVGVPVASALLHFAFPDVYPILDFRALETLGDQTRQTQYSPEFWADYAARCQAIAERAGVSIRLVDKALWQDSRRRSRRTRA